jgi:hypothetical protein
MGAFVLIILGWLALLPRTPPPMAMPWPCGPSLTESATTFGPTATRRRLAGAPPSSPKPMTATAQTAAFVVELNPELVRYTSTTTSPSSTTAG